MDDYYRILGLTNREASDSDIKSAYRKLAIKCHPDKVRGEREKKNAEKKFKEISEAYGVLSNPEKRRIYDQYGAEGVKKHEQMGSSRGGGFESFFSGAGFNPFDAFFGARGGPAERVPITDHTIHVDLDAFYFGKLIAFKVLVDQRCLKCDSSSGCQDKSKIQQCSKCQGRGKITVSRMIGPNMMAQQVLPCDQCQGKGEKIPTELICKTCQGRGMAKSSVMIEYMIERGSDYGDFLINERGDTLKDGRRGHVNLRVRPVSESKYQFSRRADDLVYPVKINLKEALIGFQRKMILFEKEPKIIESTGVVVPGMIRKKTGLGMPVRGKGDQMGDLYLAFEVIFPPVGSKLVDHDQKLIKNLVGVGGQAVINKGQREVLLVEDLELVKSQEEDDQEDGPRVECAQQ